MVQSRRDLDVSMESFWREDNAVKNGLVSSEACLFQSSDERDGELVKFRRVRDGGDRVEADCDACRRIRAESSTCLVSSTRQTLCQFGLWVWVADLFKIFRWTVVFWALSHRSLYWASAECWAWPVFLL